jgi:uncharacterized protein (DUF952 family)
MSPAPAHPLLHIAEPDAWAAAQAAGAQGSYRAASLDTEGFIHLSTPQQYVATANRYYRGRTDLVLLRVDGALLDADALRYEASTNDESFPHLYGELPLSAIISAQSFAPGPDGSFAEASSTEASTLDAR